MRIKEFSEKEAQSRLPIAENPTIALAQELKKREARIKELEALVHRLKKDSLTGLENRSGLKQQEERRKQSGRPWSVLFLDVDYFKKINDQHGHLIGDKVLKETADQLKNLFRETDSIIRFGGEEFVVVAKDAEPQDIIDKLYNKKDGHAEINFKVDLDGQSLTVALSGGVASFDREEDIEEAIERADNALLLSKASGRNQITNSLNKEELLSK